VFKRFLPFESSGDIVHAEKSGRFDIDVEYKTCMPLFNVSVAQQLIWPLLGGQTG
jgi:hypothetical protein